MGGLGHHPTHPYAVQTVAFVVSLLLPGGVFALILGSWLENLRGKAPRRIGEPVRVTPIGARFVTVHD